MIINYELLTARLCTFAAISFEIRRSVGGVRQVESNFRYDGKLETLFAKRANYSRQVKAEDEIASARGL